jgi:hypothetical protein
MLIIIIWHCIIGNFITANFFVENLAFVFICMQLANILIFTCHNEYKSVAGFITALIADNSTYVMCIF